MVGDGEMSADLQMTSKSPGQLRVRLEGKPSVANIFDKAVLQTLQDAKDGDDGLLELLEKPAFDNTRQINRPDVDHSVILRIMYLKP